MLLDTSAVLCCLKHLLCSVAGHICCAVLLDTSAVRPPQCPSSAVRYFCSISLGISLCLQQVQIDSVVKTMVVVCLLVVLTSLQRATVCQGSISCTCCHSETEAADQICYVAWPQYTNSRPTSPITDPIMAGAWQGSQWSTHF